MAEKGPLAKREEEILEFWNKEKIFEQSLAKPSPKGEFVFYDGPPFATGLPHTGSLLSSIIKDVVPRYKTMQGYHVERRWGWDCHGLPIESEVEKKLELKTKKDILAIGIEKFNETARSMVLRYVDEWERYVTRVGRWVDFKNSYKTMDNSYIESVWWALKELDKKGLLYEGRKVLMYCTHCETPLAKAEIAMDNTYKDVTDEAVTVKFKIKNPAQHKLPENSYLLAWTTTPWTLPGNAALAVGKDVVYGIIDHEGQKLIVTKPDGTLTGNLVLRGDGDPSLSPRFVRGGPGDSMSLLAQFVAGAGIRRITGDIVADGSGFESRRIPEGWLTRYAGAGYAAPFSALTLNENIVIVGVAPGKSGGAGIVFLEPATAGLAITNTVRTVAGAGPRISARRIGDDRVVVSGTIGARAGTARYQLVVGDPVTFTAGAFKTALEAQGVKVEGGQQREPVAV